MDSETINSPSSDDGHHSIVPYISLCSGYEGIGLGLGRCINGLRAIAYCEREAFAITNLVAKMENGLLDAAPVFTDVSTFPWEQFAPFMAGGILSFGWPCQPVSTAGKRKATEDERWLFDIIADGIAILQPGLLFAENVEGLLSAKMPDGSSVFGHCIERLERLHYKVTAGVFSASEVGAPHQRKRVFILANSQCDGDAGSGYELGNVGQAGQGWKNFAADSDDSWPSRPGEWQHDWEPVRTIEPPLGGDANGSASRMDYAKLCISSDNRTDELRLLGNGVVPATAALAFRTLMQELQNPPANFSPSPK